MYKDNITIFGEQYDLQDARLTDSDVASIGDIGNKADKVGNATAGNLAALDSTGNLTDSGAKPSDFLTQHQTIPDYTVSKLATAEQGYASSYVLQKDGVQVGATINIPDDTGLVHTTGAETIGGAKTFNAIVKLNVGIRFEPSAQDTYGLVASLRPYEDDAPVLYLESIGDGATPVPSYNVILRGLEIPQQYNDAATKEYVDDIVGDVETLLAAI